MYSNRTGSVLLLTLFLITLTSFAMTRFIEKAYSEILSEGLHTQRDHLRMEAYSTLETTIAILSNVEEITGALHDPVQGWGDPLALAGIEPPPGMTVRVDFVDEMGKIPLPSAERDQLRRLFELLGFNDTDSDELTDALLGWMNQGAASTSLSANHIDYERAELPYEPPYRPLRSFRELAAIAGFQEAFFDQGVPNELFHRFTSLVSLYDFPSINVNSATPEILHIWSGVGEAQIETIRTNVETNTGQLPYYRSVAEAEAAFGVPLGGAYTVQTHALRVIITVGEGGSEFMLSAVVAPSAQADSLQPDRTISGREQEPTSRGGQRARRRRGSERESAQATRRTEPGADTVVEYPYTFLLLRENETIL